MNQRHISSLFLCLILMFHTAACSNQPEVNAIVVDNSFSLQEHNNGSQKDFSYLELEIVESVDNIIALVQDSIIYYNYGENGSSAIYFKNDMDTDTTYQLGVIENPYIHTGSTAQIDDRLYFYMNEAVVDNDNPDGKLEAALYEIDTTNHSMNEVYTETAYQTLIYVDVLNEDIIAFKGKADGATGTTYIDAVTVGGNVSAGADHKVILSVDFDNDTGSGEVIYHFTQYEGSVYTLSVEAEDMENRNYLIKKFDSNGNHIIDIKLDKDIEDLLYDERISAFTVIGDYAFIRTFSSSGVLCDISSGTAEAKLIGMEDLDMAFSPASELESQYALLYNRKKGMVWLLDVSHDSISEIDIDFDYINLITVDTQNNMALISSDDMIYVDYTELPTRIIHPLSRITEALLY